MNAKLYKKKQFSLGKCKAQLQWDTTSYPSERLLSKKQTTSNGEYGGKLEPLCLAGRNVYSAATVKVTKKKKEKQNLRMIQQFHS